MLLVYICLVLVGAVHDALDVAKGTGSKAWRAGLAILLYINKRKSWLAPMQMKAMKEVLMSSTRLRALLTARGWLNKLSETASNWL